MENVEKIVLVIVGFIITSIIAYLFRMRQLYVALPKLYSHAPLSKNGTLAEIIVFNRGNQVEEDVQIEIDQSIKIELIASSSAKVILENSVIKIDRMHKGTEESAVLLVEEGALNTDKIKSLSSKGVKGRVLNKITEVPSNYAGAVVVLALFATIIYGMLYFVRNFEDITEWWMEYSLPEITKDGWDNVFHYYRSDISNSYSGAEFPLKFVSSNREKEHIVVVYQVLNKTALPMQVSASGHKNDTIEDNDSTSFYTNVDVPALSSAQLTINIPYSEVRENHVTIGFIIKNSSEFIYGMNRRTKIGISPTSKN